MCHDMQALRAGAIITALCSAAVAAAITYDASQSAVACELLHVSTGGVPMSVPVLLHLVFRSLSAFIQVIVCCHMAWHNMHVALPHSNENVSRFVGLKNSNPKVLCDPSNRTPRHCTRVNSHTVCSLKTIQRNVLGPFLLDGTHNLV